ncbi:hypothetical protein ACH5RR_035267 [Cinchona calisaya]|uniref:Uncharacterized protein n=1 Tax=Cinchona calisaya TaxID=153742 RepID=A0ABD2YEM6_9GENT
MTGRFGKAHTDSLISKSDTVNEEYMEAFRTNSFVEMCSKVQSQLGRKSLDKLSSSPSLPRQLHFSEGLLEPGQETLQDVIKASGDDIHQLLACFFQISSEACKTCELILTSIHQTRANYSAMRRLLEQIRRISDDDQQNELYRKLTSFALLRNPLSTISQVQFQDIHNNLYLSLQRITSRGKKIRRRRKSIQCCKRIAEGTLIAACCALTIALLVLVIHSALGIVSAPGLVACSLGPCMKRIKKTKPALMKTSSLEKFEGQLETAAKGIFFIINDFDTMSRLMTRLYDEIEHSKFIANLCLRRRNNEMVKEVVREFRINEIGVINQLKELEENVYLCILNINRSRRLLLEQMVVC